MIKTIRFIGSLTALLLAGTASGAQAAAVQRSFEFYATGFGAGAPLANITGTFSVTYDTAINSAGSLDSLSISYPGFSFTAANTAYNYSSSGFMTIGGSAQGASSVATNVPDFVLQFMGANSPSNSYFPLSVSYSTGTGTSWSGDFQISPYTPPPAVPEPASWAMMLGGFAAAGLYLRRRSNVATAPSVSFG
jgi:hypothetical protein